MVMKNQIVFIGVLVLHGAFARAPAPAQFSVATAPDGVPLSQQFKVRLRSAGTDLWRSAPVYAFFKQHVYNWAPTAESQFVTFDSTGDLDVEVTVSGPATAPVIRPSSRKLAVQQTGATLRFTMNDSSRQLSQEVNRDAPDPYWPEAVLSIHPTQMSEYGSTEYMGTMPPVRRVASSAGVYLIPRCFWFFLVVHTSEAANWNHEWIPVGNEIGIQWSFCPLKYDKKWA